MIFEFLEALLKAGLPTAVVTFAMVYWALLNGYLTESENHDALKKELDSMRKNKSKESSGGFLHQKWLKFGGGFYGVVALMTYAVVESIEIGDFWANFEGIRHFINTVSINLVIDFFINSLMNFVTAISWPAYWLREIESQHVWVWFVAAYLGYLTGSRIAQLVYYDHETDLE